MTLLHMGPNVSGMNRIFVLAQLSEFTVHEKTHFDHCVIRSTAHAKVLIVQPQLLYLRFDDLWIRARLGIQRSGHPLHFILLGFRISKITQILTI